eukprot:m.201773 g.201773  ORF g.201773 m.201773 type:complete len:65 (+) comp32805_c1_seq1:346-540(+)
MTNLHSPGHSAPLRPHSNNCTPLQTHSQQLLMLTPSQTRAVINNSIQHHNLQTIETHCGVISLV